MNYRLLLAFLLAAHVTGCTTSHIGKPDDRTNAALVVPSVPVATPPDSARQLRNLSVIPDKLADKLANKPALLPRLTDAIGISTPEGRAKRQARKDAAAAVPRKLGKGAQYAPNATQAVNGGNRTAGPTSAAAPNASVNNAAENSQQQNVKGDHNDLQAKQANPTQEAPGPLAVIADNLTGPLGVVLAGALVLALVAWYVEKKAA